MLQFYFLSIILNFFTGMVLLYANDNIPSRYTKIEKKEIVEVELSESTTEENVSEKTTKEEPSPVKKTKTKLKKQPGKHNSVQTFFLLNKFINDRSFRLLLGVLTFFTGIMKLLSTSGKSLPVIGDLFPAIAGLFGGFAVLLEYYFMSTTTDAELPDWIVLIFIKNKRLIGMLCIAVAVLHFVFPTIILF